jgi:hypothetical protein
MVLEIMVVVLRWYDRRNNLAPGTLFRVRATSAPADGAALRLGRAGDPGSARLKKCRTAAELRVGVFIIASQKEWIMRLHRLSVAVATLLLPGLAAAQPTAWRTYVVAETGAKVDVPVTIFSEDGGKPDDGYGRRFLTSDRRANLTVQSIPNAINDSPAAFLAKKNPPSDIVYKRVTSRFFVVSSIRNGRIWYNRCNRSARNMQCVLINYPAAEKRQWDGVVTRISNSLTSS